MRRNNRRRGGGDDELSKADARRAVICLVPVTAALAVVKVLLVDERDWSTALGAAGLIAAFTLIMGMVVVSRSK